MNLISICCIYTTILFRVFVIKKSGFFCNDEIFSNKSLKIRHNPLLSTIPSIIANQSKILTFNIITFF